MNLAGKYDVEYNGWSIYFEGPNSEEGEDDGDEDLVNRDDDNVRH